MFWAVGGAIYFWIPRSLTQYLIYSEGLAQNLLYKYIMILTWFYFNKTSIEGVKFLGRCLAPLFASISSIMYVWHRRVYPDTTRYVLPIWTASYNFLKIIHPVCLPAASLAIEGNCDLWNGWEYGGTKIGNWTGKANFFWRCWIQVTNT